MSPEKTVAAIGLFVVVLTLLLTVSRKLPKRIKTTYYVRKWRDIQKLCGSKEEWSHAIVHADTLLDDVLKRRKVSGKTMGERLVNSQDKFSANDSIWDAHKLANILRHDSSTKKMSENEVKDALIAFRQALRDLGAL